MKKPTRGERPFLGKSDNRNLGDRKPFGAPRDRNVSEERSPKNERPSFNDRPSFSDRDRGPRGDRNDRPSFGDRPSFNDRAPRGNRDERPSFGDRDRAPRGDRNDRPSFGDRPNFNDRAPRGDRDERPSFGDRDRGPRGDRNDRPSFGDRPNFNDRAPRGDRDERPSFGDRDRGPRGDRNDRPSFGDRPNFNDRAPRGDRDERPSFGDRKPSFGNNNERPSFGDRSFNDRAPRGDRNDRPSFGDRPSFNDRAPRGDRDERPSFGDRKPSFGNNNERPSKPRFGKSGDLKHSDPDFLTDDERFRRASERHAAGRSGPKPKANNKPQTRPGAFFNKFIEENNRKPEKQVMTPHMRMLDRQARELEKEEKKTTRDAARAIPEMRLNKYLAHSGIGARRKCDELIEAGHVTVNGTVVTEMGHRVQPQDIVAFKGEVVKPTRHFVYILLNKPKGIVTTTEDEKDRRTVLDLVTEATNERIYPVGRLDRATTGLLLLTNDGELAQKLSHPSFELNKQYLVGLDKEAKEEDLLKLMEGVTMEDGVAKADKLEYIMERGHEEVMIHLHIGRNRIVRRMFEHIGYEVLRLERVRYGPLTKKGLPRGGWRHLSKEEVIMLKHLA